MFIISLFVDTRNLFLMFSINLLGKVMTEDKVNEDDMVSGNEYLANLDFIEGVEKLKEGYESEAYCSDTENESNKKTMTMKTGPLWKNTIFHEDSSSGEGMLRAKFNRLVDVGKRNCKYDCFQTLPPFTNGQTGTFF